MQAECPPVLADPGQLESALLNIAINARDAMPDGGKLLFRGEAALELPDQVRRELDGADAAGRRFVTISIADTGCGMPEDVKERAFEPFFTTKEAGRGTGLGLSTVYGFVKQSKGAIAIASRPGFGTVLALYIPEASARSIKNGTNTASAEAIPTGLKVLLVEDDLEVRKVANTFLRQLHCEATSVANAGEALEALERSSSFDLLVTDIALGSGLRGTELAAKAQQRFPRLAILLVSGYSSELLAADADSPPSWQLLRKPYSRSELARAIAGLLVSRPQ